jgi:hypothetical protein
MTTRFETKPTPRSHFGNRKKRKYKYNNNSISAAFEKRALLEEIREVTHLQGVGLCFPYKNGYPWPSKALPLFNQGLSPRNCGNSHACPVCASRYMAIRRATFEVAAEAWVKNGGFMMQSKLSLRNDPLIETVIKYRELSSNWTRMRNLSRYKTLADSAGQPHFVKILEESISDTGLFPHLHVVWLFSDEVSPAAARNFLVEIARLWCTIANRHSLGAGRRGQYVGQLSSTNLAGIGDYFFKHGFFDLKSDPRSVAKPDPFMGFRRYLLTGEIDYLIFWFDFELASARQNRVRFSSAFPFLLD